MSQTWLVLFDCNGVDMLVPVDEIKNKEILLWMGGEEFQSELGTHLSIAKMRAMANPQRHPEVWVYSTSDDLPLEDMRKMWDERAQAMANLVRSKGTCVYKTPREKNVIV